MHLDSYFASITYIKTHLFTNYYQLLLLIIYLNKKFLMIYLLNI